MWVSDAFLMGKMKLLACLHLLQVLHFKAWIVRGFVRPFVNKFNLCLHDVQLNKSYKDRACSAAPIALLVGDQLRL